MFYTFGDGFAAGHIWPEWPQMLEAVTQTDVMNFGHVGAGNEYIFNCAIKSALTASTSDVFLVQWAPPNRFDKIKQDIIWQQLHDNDTNYKGIQSDVFAQRWWSTSASDTKEILDYKNFYIQSDQTENRSVLYMIALSNMLNFLNIKHFYFFTYTHDYSTHLNFKDLQLLPWVGNKSMYDWAKGMPEYGPEIQPSPIVHLKWVIEKILPALGINILPNRQKIEKLIETHIFVPFHHDRKQHWEDLKFEISLLCK
jgi:hypothetical protein